MQLSGKKAFVTGGARRLGRAVVLHLASAGCAVTAHYNRSEADAVSLQKESGCALFRADFLKVTIPELERRLEQEVGPVDLLVNNASTFTRRDWKAVTEEQWDQELTVNLKIPFFLSRFFGRKMKTSGSGKIINMLDIAAERPYLHYLPYSVARAAGISVTRAFARALAPEVQVNGIAPGTILFPDDAPDDLQRTVLGKIPAGRTGTVDELLRAVDYLVTGGDYVTGHILVLDGGRTLTW